MTRKGYYLKRTGRGTTPGLFVSVVVSSRTVHGEESDPRCRTRVFHSVAVAWSYHSRSGWTHPRTLRFGTTDAFWGWLDAKGKQGRRCYVFSPIASDSLTLLAFWTRRHAHRAGRLDGDTDTARVRHGTLPEGGISIRRLVVNGRPDVIGYSLSGCSYLWLSGRQYWDYSSPELCRLFPPAAAGGLSGDAQSVSVMPRMVGEATSWLRAMTTFADWWAGMDAGPFPRTIPSAAMQFFRSRMTLKSIVVHRDEEAYRLERAACHGGRASLWYYGTIVDRSGRVVLSDERPVGYSAAEMDGPVYRLDVRSMYPSLLRDRMYPVRLVRYSERYTVDDIQSLARRYGVIAEVQLDTDRDEYPCRDGESVSYPLGRFRSVLCGAELDRAILDGIVKTVWRAAVYEMGRPFHAAAAELCEMRELYRSRGQTHFELLAKLLGNSLAGKLAQRPRGWQEVTGVAHHPEWDVWIDYNADTRVVTHKRSIAGRVYEYRDIGVGQGCLTASFAFLTSYGRSLMRSYREICPCRSVISQDTDGLWVNADGLASLRGTYADRDVASIGQLALIGSHSAAYWLSPKHYCTPDGWVLAGYHHPGLPRKGMVRDTYDVNPVRTGCTGPPTTVDHFVINRKLPSPPPAYMIDADGWSIPPRLPEPIERGHFFGPPPEPDEPD